MYDLIYAEEHRKDIEAEILEKYPEAMIEDASDFIHRGRFSVEIDCEDDEWRKWCFRNGVFELSLAMQALKVENPEEYIDIMRSVVAEIKVESEEQS